MITFDITPSTVTIASEDPEQLANASIILDEALKSKNPQAHMINSRLTKWGTPVPYHHVAYDTTTCSFPRGLLYRACLSLREAGLTFQVRAVEGYPQYAPDNIWWHGHMPRDYQMEAVQAWLQAQYGTVVVPTRGGKTLIGCLAASAVIKRLPVVWLVTKTEAQADVLDTWFTHFGGYPAVADCEPTGLSVLTYATATKRDLSHFGLLIADEVHRAAADTYYEAVQSATSAWYRLGLTGTPEGRSDGKEIFLEGGIGPVIYKIDRQILISRGLCSSGVTRRVIYNTPLPIDGGHGNWTQIERVGIVENRNRDHRLILAALDARQSSEQMLFLCRRQAHAKAVAELLTDVLGVEVPAMDSKRSKKVRAKVYQQFADGDLQAVVATGIYDDSMTFPHLKILVNMAGGKSSILTGQRLGRALAGDKSVVIIDCSDEHYETLRGHAKKRFRVYEREGYPVTDWRMSDG